MNQDKSASASADRAAGLQPQPPTAFSQSSIPSAWQPIETAPRDGTTILAGYFNQPWSEGHREGQIAQVWFQPEFNAFISSCREMTLASGYSFEGGATRRLHSPTIEGVTHWMPLPPPPEGNAP